MHNLFVFALSHCLFLRNRFSDVESGYEDVTNFGNAPHDGNTPYNTITPYAPNDGITPDVSPQRQGEAASSLPSTYQELRRETQYTHLKPAIYLQPIGDTELQLQNQE